jgi:hypothetical protein
VIAAVKVGVIDINRRYYQERSIEPIGRERAA